MPDPGIHINCTCPHCGKDAKIRHADLIRMMGEMAAEFAKHPGRFLPDDEAMRLPLAAARARASAIRWGHAAKVSWYVLAAASIFNAGYTALTQTASPAILICANLTTALAAFVLAGYAMPGARRST